MATNVVQMVLKLQDKASKSLGNIGKEAKKTTVSAKGLGTAFAALGAAAVAGAAAFVKMGQEVADVVNELNDMSVVTGMSVDTLHDLQLMARATGLQIDVFREGLLKFSESIGRAKAEAGPLAEAFAQLGLDPNAFKDNDDALRQTMKALEKIEDVNERNRISMQLFGGAAAHMSKAMQTSMSKAAQAQELLNIRLSESTAESGQMQASLGLMEQTLDHMKVAAFSAFAGPGGFASGVAVVIGVIKAVVELLTQMGNVVLGLFKSIGYAVNALASAAEGDADSFYSYSEKASEANKQMWEGMVKLALPFAEGSWIDVGVKGALDFEEAVAVLTSGQKKATAEGRKAASTYSKASQEAEKYKDELLGVARAASALSGSQLMSAGQRYAPDDYVVGVPRTKAEENQQKIKASQYIAGLYESALSEAADAVEGSTGFKSMQDILLMMVDTGEGNIGLYSALSDVKMLSAEYERLNAMDHEGARRAQKMYRFAVEEATELMLKQNPMLAAMKDGRDLVWHSVQAYGSYGAELAKMMQGQTNSFVVLGEAMDSAGESYRQIGEAQAYLAKSGPESAEDAVSRLTGEAEALVAELDRLGRAQADLVALGTDPAYIHEIGVTAQRIAKEHGEEAGKQYLNNMRLALEDGMGDLSAQLGTTGLALEAVMKDLKVADLEVEKITAKEARVESIEAFTARMDQIGGVLSDLSGGNLLGGAQSALGAMGPAGAAAGSVVGMFASISELGQMAQDSSVKDVAREVVKSAEDQIEGIETGLEILRQALPEILAMLIVELPIAIIKSLPAMVEALYLAFTRALGQLWGWIKGAFGGTKEDRQKRRQDRGEYWADWAGNLWDSVVRESERGKKEGLESYAMGTPYVGRTGVALLHKGESVVPVNGRAQQGARAGGAPVNINISASIIDRDVIPRLVREIERATGKYGRMTASFA